jgi:hypothetical protein
MTTDNFCFYLQNRLIQTSQTGGQGYSDTSPFSVPWLGRFALFQFACAPVTKTKLYNSQTGVRVKFVQGKAPDFGGQLSRS